MVLGRIERSRELVFLSLYRHDSFSVYMTTHSRRRGHSLRQDLRGKHKIARNGYNVGRDLIVQKAIGGTRYLGRSWETRVEYIEGLLKPGSEGVSAR